MRRHHEIDSDFSRQTHPSPISAGKSKLPVVGSVNTSHKNPTSKTLYGFADAQLIARSSRAGDARLLWLWHITKYAANGANCAFIDELYTRARKADRTLSKTQFDYYMRAGEKAGYWNLTGQGRRGQDYRRKVFYTSYSKLSVAGATDDGTNHVGAMPFVEINLRWRYFLPHAYAAWMAVHIKAKLRVKTNILGQKKRSARTNALHISRQTLERVWGVTVPTLIKWEKIARIKVTRGIEQSNEHARLGIDTHADVRPYATTDGKTQWVGRAINSYIPPVMRMSESKRTRLNVRRECRAIVKAMGTDSQPASINGQSECLNSDGGLPVPFVPISFDNRKSNKGFKSAKAYCNRHKGFTGAIRVLIGVDQYGRNVWERVVTAFHQTTPLCSRDIDRMNTPQWIEYSRQMRLGIAAL